MGRQETHDHKKEKNTKPHKKTRALSPQVLLLARYLSPAASLKYSCNYDHVSTGKYKMSNINMHFTESSCLFSSLISWCSFQIWKVHIKMQ